MVSVPFASCWRGTYDKVEIEQPEDRGVLLKDVLETTTGQSWKEKAYTLDANYYKAADGTDAFNDEQSGSGLQVAEPICVAERGRYTGTNGEVEQHFEARADGKTNTITTVCKDNNVAEPVRIGTIERHVYEVRNGPIAIDDKAYPIKLLDGFYIIRKLTVRECMRLQTVPEWYDFSCVSNSQAYKCLGNGWTVEVIAHLIKNTIDRDQRV